MYSVQFDAKPLIGQLDDIAKRQLPFATMQALNETLFGVHKGVGERAQRVLDRPTPHTARGLRYTKATKTNLVAEVFEQSEAEGYTPVARYIAHQVKGGPRPVKAFENDLRNAGVLGQDEFVVPAKGMTLDSYGNVPASVINAMLSDLQASKDATRRSTPESRRKRARRKKGQGLVYFYWRGDSGGGRNKHRLPRGIYQRRGILLRMVFVIIQGAPTYAPRFDFYQEAERLFHRDFPGHFSTHLARAIASAKR